MGGRRSGVVETVGAVASVAALTLAACSSFSAAADDPGDAGVAAADASLDAGASLDADAAQSPYATAVLADKPVAYFRFEDENVVEGGAIYDEVSKKRVGIVYGRPTFGVDGATAFGHAATFDGASHIDLGNKYGFPANAPFTIELFVKPAGTQFGHLFTKQQRGGPKEGYAVTVDSAVILERYVASASLRTQPGNVTTTTFWYAACTYDGTQLAMYVNGQSVGAPVLDPRPSMDYGTPALIGAAAPNGEASFSGVIDELAIYDKALGPSQIAAHFTSR